MLRITLKPGEDLLIGDNVVVRFMDGRRHEVGIDAPREIVVLRSSLLQKRDGDEENACNPPADL